jgi:hypothetical protein
LVGTDGRRVQAGITVEIICDSGNGQASTYTRTRAIDVQIARRRISIRIQILWINRNAVGVLACGSLPGGERRLTGGIKDADYSTGPGSIEIVVIAGEPRGIGARATDGDRRIRSDSRGVAAGVIENVVPEVARVVHHIAEECQRI